MNNAAMGLIDDEAESPQVVDRRCRRHAARVLGLIEVFGKPGERGKPPLDEVVRKLVEKVEAMNSRG